MLGDILKIIFIGTCGLWKGFLKKLNIYKKIFNLFNYKIVYSIYIQMLGNFSTITTKNVAT